MCYINTIKYILITIELCAAEPIAVVGLPIWRPKHRDWFFASRPWAFIPVDFKQHLTAILGVILRVENF